MNNPKHEMQKLLFENVFADHSIQYILKDDNSIYSLSVSKSDPDEIISFIKDNDGNSIYEYVPVLHYILTVHVSTLLCRFLI